jgi:DNA-binding Lrp family transcriptional regulator
MQAKLDSQDVKILEAAGTYGPRNLRLLATELGMKRGTVWKRVQRLSSNFSLEFHVNPYHTNMGLKKALVLAWANPGKEDLLFDCLYVNDFRNFISRCYGTREGCFAVYIIPVDHIAEFMKFLPVIKREATDNRNFVKKAVNWALRQIGKRNLILNRAALQTAKEIVKIDSKAARWVASDALRELESDFVQKKVKSTH